MQTVWTLTNTDLKRLIERAIGIYLAKDYPKVVGGSVDEESLQRAQRVVLSDLVQDAL